MEKVNKGKRKPRKQVEGPIRNKVRTKTELLNTVSQLLRDNGHHPLTISSITKLSKKNAKLIYIYFGSVENLIKTYVENQQFWQVLTALQSETSLNTDKPLYDILIHRLEIHLKFLLENKEFLALIIWDIGEKSRFLRTFTVQKEEYFSKFFFRENEGKECQVDLYLLDLIISSITHLCAYARQDISWMGISLNSPDDYRRVVNKIASLILNSK